MQNDHFKVTINDGYIDLGKADRNQKHCQDIKRNLNARGEPHPQKRNEYFKEETKKKSLQTPLYNLSLNNQSPMITKRNDIEMTKRKYPSSFGNKYRGKTYGIPEKNFYTSQSEFSLNKKTVKINKKSPSTPSIQNNICKLPKSDNIEDQVPSNARDNKCTMTTNANIGHHKNTIEEPEEFKNCCQSVNETQYFANQQWRDPRLLAKYSILNMPWRRTWTIPVFLPKSSNVSCNAALQDAIDRQTYLYDDGTEVDSVLLENKNKIFRKKKNFHYKLNPFLLMGGSLFGILLVAILVWLTYGTDIFKLFFKPKEVDNDNVLKRYMKYMGGSLIYIISSIISSIAKVLTIPTNQVFSNQEENDRMPFRM